MTPLYDDLPYTEHAYAEAHPDNLVVVARLAGWQTAAPAAPRVLELGCGRGGHLLPMASAWSDATFVGVDSSPAQIQHATRIADTARLSNIAFEACDLTRVQLPPGSFDFILCHGVYSWVAPATRRALLSRVRAWLAPYGVAHVSYNTLPGWYRKLAARDWLRFAARWNGEPHRDPREELAWLVGAVSKEHDAYRRDLAAVSTRLASADRAYVTHEYLAEEHHPVHVTTFLAEAADAGLAYLGDAQPAATLLDLSPDDVKARALALDVPRREALVDFTRDTAFRRSVLVPADAAVGRAFTAPSRLHPEALSTMRVASSLAAEGDSFVGPRASVQASGPLAVALHRLAEAAPRSIAFPELSLAVGRCEGLSADLLDLWLAGTGVDLHVREPLLTPNVSAFPESCPVARWHAAHGGPITNRWHQEVVLPEAIVRFILSMLDGTASHAELATRVAAQLPGLAPASVSDVVSASLSLLARSSLLVR